MKTLVTAAAALLLATPMLAQATTTIGGTNSSPTRVGLGKGNGVYIKSSVLLLDFDMYLNVPGQETLEFFVYHHHSQSGTYNLVKTWKVPVNGTGKGATWYSSGTIAYPLLCDNYYIIGVAWKGSVTYHYNVATCGSQIAIGNWLFGRTANTTNPLQTTMSGGGCDAAQYYQRFRTLPNPNVTCLGTGCASGTPPRLLATTPPQVGTTFAVEMVGGAGSTPAMVLLSPFRALANPVPIAGCQVWLDLRLPVISLGVPLSSSGEAKLPFPIPQNNVFAGVRFAMQAGVLGSRLDITNAVDLLSY
jgi:hypothetical protein